MTMNNVYTESDLVYAIDMALYYRGYYSQPSKSGKRVGSCLISSNKTESCWDFFGGANIEFATSFCVHAERVSLIKAVSEGFINPLCIVVSGKRGAAMCGYCRQDYMYVNPNTRIVIVNDDKEIIRDVTLKDTLSYPYLSSGSKLVEYTGFIPPLKRDYDD